MPKIFSKIKLTYLFTNRYLSLAWLVLLQLLLMLRPGWNNFEIKLYQRCFSVVSTSYTDGVSTLCNVENPTLDFVSFLTSDQRYFNLYCTHIQFISDLYRTIWSTTLKHRWSDVISTLKLGHQIYCESRFIHVLSTILTTERLSYISCFMMLLERTLFYCLLHMTVGFKKMYFI